MEQSSQIPVSSNSRGVVRGSGKDSQSFSLSTAPLAMLSPQPTQILADTHSQSLTNPVLPSLSSQTTTTASGIISRGLLLSSQRGSVSEFSLPPLPTQRSTTSAMSQQRRPFRSKPAAPMTTLHTQAHSQLSTISTHMSQDESQHIRPLTISEKTTALQNTQELDPYISPALSTSAATTEMAGWPSLPRINWNSMPQSFADKYQRQEAATSRNRQYMPPDVIPSVAMKRAKAHDLTERQIFKKESSDSSQFHPSQTTLYIPSKQASSSTQLSLPSPSQTTTPVPKNTSNLMETEPIMSSLTKSFSTTPSRTFHHPSNKSFSEEAHDEGAYRGNYALEELESRMDLGVGLRGLTIGRSGSRSARHFSISHQSVPVLPETLELHPSLSKNACRLRPGETSQNVFSLNDDEGDGDVSVTCETCGSNQMSRDQAGLMFCEICGTRNSKFIYTLQENEFEGGEDGSSAPASSFAGLRRIHLVQQSTLESNGMVTETDPQIITRSVSAESLRATKVALQAFQHVLIACSRAAVQRFGLHPSLVSTSVRLWLRLLYWWRAEGWGRTDKDVCLVLRRGRLFRFLWGLTSINKQYTQSFSVPVYFERYRRKFTHEYDPWYRSRASRDARKAVYAERIRLYDIKTKQMREHFQTLSGEQKENKTAKENSRQSYTDTIKDVEFGNLSHASLEQMLQLVNGVRCGKSDKTGGKSDENDENGENNENDKNDESHNKTSPAPFDPMQNATYLEQELYRSVEGHFSSTLTTPHIWSIDGEYIDFGVPGSIIYTAGLDKELSPTLHSKKKPKHTQKETSVNDNAHTMSCFGPPVVSLVVGSEGIDRTLLDPFDGADITHPLFSRVNGVLGIPRLVNEIQSDSDNSEEDENIDFSTPKTSNTTPSSTTIGTSFSRKSLRDRVVNLWIEKALRVASRPADLTRLDEKDEENGEKERSFHNFGDGLIDEEVSDNESSTDDENNEDINLNRRENQNHRSFPATRFGFHDMNNDEDESTTLSRMLRNDSQSSKVQKTRGYRVGKSQPTRKVVQIIVRPDGNVSEVITSLSNTINMSKPTIQAKKELHASTMIDSDEEDRCKTEDHPEASILKVKNEKIKTEKSQKCESQNSSQNQRNKSDLNNVVIDSFSTSTPANDLLSSSISTPSDTGVIETAYDFYLRSSEGPVSVPGNAGSSSAKATFSLAFTAMPARRAVERLRIRLTAPLAQLLESLRVGKVQLGDKTLTKVSNSVFLVRKRDVFLPIGPDQAATASLGRDTMAVKMAKAKVVTANSTVASTSSISLPSKRRMVRPTEASKQHRPTSETDIGTKRMKLENDQHRDMSSSAASLSTLGSTTANSDADSSGSQSESDSMEKDPDYVDSSISATSIRDKGRYNAEGQFVLSRTRSTSGKQNQIQSFSSSSPPPPALARLRLQEKYHRMNWADYIDLQQQANNPETFSSLDRQEHEHYTTSGLDWKATAARLRRIFYKTPRSVEVVFENISVDHIVLLSAQLKARRMRQLISRVCALLNPSDSTFIPDKPWNESGEFVFHPDFASVEQVKIREIFHASLAKIEKDSSPISHSCNLKVGEKSSVTSPSDVIFLDHSHTRGGHGPLPQDAMIHHNTILRLLQSDVLVETSSSTSSTQHTRLPLPLLGYPGFSGDLDVSLRAPHSFAASSALLSHLYARAPQELGFPSISPSLQRRWQYLYPFCSVTRLLEMKDSELLLNSRLMTELRLFIRHRSRLMRRKAPDGKPLRMPQEVDIRLANPQSLPIPSAPLFPGSAQARHVYPPGIDARNVPLDENNCALAHRAKKALRALQPDSGQFLPPGEEWRHALLPGMLEMELIPSIIMLAAMSNREDVSMEELIHACNSGALPYKNMLKTSVLYKRNYISNMKVFSFEPTEALPETLKKEVIGAQTQKQTQILTQNQKDLDSTTSSLQVWEPLSQSVLSDALLESRDVRPTTTGPMARRNTLVPTLHNSTSNVSWATPMGLSQTNVVSTMNESVNTTQLTLNTMHSQVHTLVGMADNLATGTANPDFLALSTLPTTQMQSHTQARTQSSSSSSSSSSALVTSQRLVAYPHTLTQKPETQDTRPSSLISSEPTFKYTNTLHFYVTCSDSLSRFFRPNSAYTSKVASLVSQLSVILNAPLPKRQLLNLQSGLNYASDPEFAKSANLSPIVPPNFAEFEMGASTPVVSGSTAHLAALTGSTGSTSTLTSSSKGVMVNSFNNEKPTVLDYTRVLPWEPLIRVSPSVPLMPLYRISLSGPFDYVQGIASRNLNHEDKAEKDKNIVHDEYTSHSTRDLFQRTLTTSIRTSTSSSPSISTPMASITSPWSAGSASSSHSDSLFALQIASSPADVLRIAYLESDHIGYQLRSSSTPLLRLFRGLARLRYSSHRYGSFAMSILSVYVGRHYTPTETEYDKDAIANTSKVATTVTSTTSKSLTTAPKLGPSVALLRVRDLYHSFFQKLCPPGNRVSLSSRITTALDCIKKASVLTPMIKAMAQSSRLIRRHAPSAPSLSTSYAALHNGEIAGIITAMVLLCTDFLDIVWGTNLMRVRPVKNALTDVIRPAVTLRTIHHTLSTAMPTEIKSKIKMKDIWENAPIMALEGLTQVALTAQAVPSLEMNFSSPEAISQALRFYTNYKRRANREELAAGVSFFNLPHLASSPNSTTAFELQTQLEPKDTTTSTTTIMTTTPTITTSSLFSSKSFEMVSIADNFSTSIVTVQTARAAGATVLSVDTARSSRFDKERVVNQILALALTTSPLPWLVPFQRLLPRRTALASALVRVLNGVAPAPPSANLSALGFWKALAGPVALPRLLHTDTTIEAFFRDTIGLAPRGLTSDPVLHRWVAFASKTANENLTPMQVAPEPGLDLVRKAHTNADVITDHLTSSQREQIENNIQNTTFSTISEPSASVIDTEDMLDFEQEIDNAIENEDSMNLYSLAGIERNDIFDTDTFQDPSASSGRFSQLDFSFRGNTLSRPSLGRGKNPYGDDDDDNDGNEYDDQEAENDSFYGKSLLNSAVMLTRDGNNRVSTHPISAASTSSTETNALGVNVVISNADMIDVTDIDLDGRLDVERPPDYTEREEGLESENNQDFCISKATTIRRALRAQVGPLEDAISGYATAVLQENLKKPAKDCIKSTLWQESRNLAGAIQSNLRETAIPPYRRVPLVHPNVFDPTTKEYREVNSVAFVRGYVRLLRKIAKVTNATVAETHNSAIDVLNVLLNAAGEYGTGPTQVYLQRDDRKAKQKVSKKSVTKTPSLP